MPKPRPAVLRLLPALGSPVMRLALHLANTGLLFVAAHAAWALTHPDTPGGLPARYLNLTLSAALLLVLLGAPAQRSFRGGDFMGLALKLTGSWCATLGAGMLWLFFSKTTGDYSRSWALMWAGMGLVLLLGKRALVYTLLRYVRAKGYNDRRVAVVGTGATISYLLSRMGPAR